MARRLLLVCALGGEGVKRTCTIADLVRRSLDPRFVAEVVRKARSKIRDGLHRTERAESTSWCRSHAEDPAAWAGTIDAGIWDEATAFGAAHVDRVRSLLTGSAASLGGSGYVALLYFLTRVYRPARVVETGVAAGHSSRAILRALAANGHGHLWSSDLPYFMLDGAEAMIGALVEDELKSRWTLRTDGDRRCLPAIARQAEPIDLFHYDSDKSRDGRTFALSVIAPHLAPGATVVFDDIEDNRHFRELAGTFAQRFHVFAFQRKWVGMLRMPEGADLRRILPALAPRWR